MTNAGDSAEQMVRLSLNGTEVVVKLAGEGIKNLVLLLNAISKDKTHTVGKARLLDMIKTNKEQKIFSIKAKHLPKFKNEAKKYGVMYCTLIDRKNKDSDKMVDIIVKAEDASKINRIVERFNLSAIENSVSVRTDMGKEKVNPNLALTEKDNLSKHISENKGITKPSVKKELDKITKDMNLEGKIPPLPKSRNKGEQVK